MTDIQLQNWTATSGVAPTVTYDATSGFRYESWALNNEKGGNFIVPAIVSGSTITLKFQESTPGQSLKHKWQANVTLLEPGSDPTNVDADEAFTTEFTSPATANILTNREFVITTAGQIASTTPAQGDTVNVVLKRIAASGSEDGNSIKLGPVTVYIIPGSESLTSYVGRAGSIIDDVLTLFNDKSQGFITGTEILGWINQCTREAAKKGAFKTNELIDLTASDGDIDLFTLFTDHDQIISMTWEATGRPLYPIKTVEEFQRALMIAPSGSEMMAYFIASNVLYWVPVPSANATGAVRVWRRYRPAAMTGLTGNCTPPVPEDYDSTYMNYCLMRAHMTDRGSKTAEKNISMYASLFKQDLGRLMEQGVTPGFRMMPCR